MSQGAASITLSGNQRKDPDEAARQLEKQSGALRTLGGREHGDKSKDDAVDQHRIEGIERAHGDGQRIGVTVRTQQVGDQRHADDTEHIAGEDADDDRQATAHQWALHRAGDHAFRVGGRR